MKLRAIFVFGVIFFLTACGKDSKTDPTTDKQPEISSAPVTEQPSAPARTDSSDPKCQGNYAVVRYNSVAVKEKTNGRFSYGHILFIFVPSHPSKMEKVELEITDGSQTVRTPVTSSDAIVSSGIVNSTMFTEGRFLSLVSDEWGQQKREDYLSRFHEKFFTLLNFAHQRLVEGTNTYVFSFIRDGCPSQRQEIRHRF